MVILPKPNSACLVHPFDDWMWWTDLMAEGKCANEVELIVNRPVNLRTNTNWGLSQCRITLKGEEFKMYFLIDGDHPYDVSSVQRISILHKLNDVAIFKEDEKPLYINEKNYPPTSQEKLAKILAGGYYI